MNDARKKKIIAISGRLKLALSDMEAIQSDEQEYLDKLIDSNKEDSDNYSESETALSSIEDGVSSLESAIDSFSEIE